MMHDGLVEQAQGAALEAHAPELVRLANEVWLQRPHGELGRWRRMIESLPMLTPEHVDLTADAIKVTASGIEEEPLRRIKTGLLSLHPWRKGPFDIHGMRLDAEWRSDLKWRRLRRHIAPLEGRKVLDVGCGNGYYGLRMLGEGADLVVGIDPTQLFLMQYQAIRHFLGAGPYPLFLLPLGVEDLPREMAAFDSVFSMGVFYHRRSPFDHLVELREALRQGGELVLETLVVEDADVLVPEGRYAKMRNVWFIPSTTLLLGWLRRAGFHEPRVVDVTATTTAEQRRTEWMRFESLSDFLDPQEPSRTIEGHPAPRRAIFLAQR